MPFLNHRIINEDMLDIYQRDIDWYKLREQTVVITGATGMLASYLSFFLLYLNEKHSMNITIILVVRNVVKARQLFGDYIFNKNLKIYTFDINSPWIIEEKIDYIIHAASLASPQYYSVVPVDVAAPNAIGTYYMLRFAHKNHVKKVLFFSSGDVYGDINIVSGAITENMMGVLDPLDEHSCYGESKRMGETWCAAFYKQFDVPVVIARIAHTYSPTMDIRNDPRVFSSFMKCLYEKKDIVMYSDGSAKRPFCYIADAVAAFFLLLTKGKSGEAYNVCNSAAFITVFALANILVKLRPEWNLKVVSEVRPNHDSYLENPVHRENCPTEGKLKELGWTCHYGIKDGFERVLEFLQESGYGL